MINFKGAYSAVYLGQVVHEGHLVVPRLCIRQLEQTVKLETHSRSWRGGRGEQWRDRRRGGRQAQTHWNMPLGIA